MQPIVPAFSPVNICFATNGGYAPYLAVSLYSLLCNADKSRLYDIVVLCNDVPEESPGTAKLPLTAIITNMKKNYRRNYYEYKRE